MNLINIKDCSKCINSLVYGNSDDMIIRCISDDYMARELFNKDGRCCAKFCKCFTLSNKNRTGKINQENALRFLLSGNSDFILHSTKTNDDFRFILNVQESKDKKNNFIYFVNIIKATSKIYCGIVWFDKETKEFKYAQGNKGQIPGTSVEIRSLLFVFNKLYNNDIVNFLEIYSIGKCGCCGKGLETVEDLEIGLHKECNNKISLNKIFNDN